MAKKILLGLLALIVVFAIVVATRPSSFHVERTAEMAATPDVPYSLVSDFHQWEKWSPWEKLDPSMKRTFDGAPAGSGAIYTWVGNDKVGEGKMTITDAKPNEKVAIKLEFIKPWTATNETTFAFAAAGDKTKVTWAMDGQLDFMGKAFGMFMNMNDSVGKDFDQGLANMKSAAEADSLKRKEEAEKAAAAAGPADGAPAGNAPPKQD